MTTTTTTTTASSAFTPSELRTLLSLADTLIPSIPPSASVPDAAFASECPSQNPQFIASITDGLACHVPPDKFAELKRVLWMLGGVAGSVLFTGGVTPVERLGVEKREWILRGWKHSNLAFQRNLFRVFSTLVINTYLRTSTTFHHSIDYATHGSYAYIPIPPPHYRFDFEASTADFAKCKFDVIIVGSGSGGGVVAKKLAEAGKKVLVVEKGQYWPNTGFSEAEAYEKLYEHGVRFTETNGNCSIAAGSTFGGGSTVNWAASLQPPAAVRKDWVQNHNLPFFDTPAFQSHLDHVCDYMGVTLPTKHNHANAILLEGSRLCGYSCSPVPQNTGGTPDHPCGADCANGCRFGTKQGGVHSWLVDAAEAGARFLTNAEVLTVNTTPSRRAVRGVTLRLPDGSHSHINCSTVVCSAGSIHTPALLLRSGVKNSQLGKNLHLHPVTLVYARWAHPVRPYEGNILTAVVTEHANKTPSGHGVRIESMNMQPAMGGTMMPWHGGAAFKARLAQFNYLTSYISIVRDTTGGTVTLHPRTGQPVVNYTINKLDGAHNLLGMATCAEILAAAGAEEIFTGLRTLPAWNKGDDIHKWCKDVLNTCGAPNERIKYASAHQMSSARMGATRKEGVCDPRGQVWDTKGLWIADSSALPSASGVNPMISTMALADYVAGNVVDDQDHVRASL